MSLIVGGSDADVATYYLAHASAPSSLAIVLVEFTYCLPSELFTVFIVTLDM
jgi:hypothetical protein